MSIEKDAYQLFDEVLRRHGVGDDEATADDELNSRQRADFAAVHQVAIELEVVIGVECVHNILEVGGRHFEKRRRNIEKGIRVAFREHGLRSDGDAKSEPM